MAASTRHGLYTASLEGLTVDQISGCQVSTGVSNLVRTAGGALDPGIVNVSFADPTVRITTADLNTVMTSATLSAGLDITSAAEFQFQKRASGGTFASGTSHITINATLGFFYVESITVTQDTTTGAELNGTFVAHYDGTNDPLTISTSQAIVNSPALNNVYHLGGVKIGTTQIPGVQSLTIDTGIRYETRRADGEPYARIGSIMARNPSITLTTIQLDEASTYGLFGSALSSTLTCYFQEAAAGGTRTAQATTNHIAVTASAGELHATDVGVTGDGDTVTSIMITNTSTLGQSLGTAISNIS